MIRVTSPPPIALQPDEGEALWFLGGLLTVKAASASTAGRMAVIEHRAPRGLRLAPARPPPRGRVVLRRRGRADRPGRRARERRPAGSFVYGPRDIPHTFQVTSPEARFTLVAEPGGFDDFVRALADPAAERALPPAGHPVPDPERLMAAAAEYGIEILGPPGIPS